MTWLYDLYAGPRLAITMEALAIVKTEMRLRVVISFVKVGVN